MLRVYPGNGEGDGPCTNCLDRGQHCTSTTPRRWRARDGSRESKDLVERLEQLETLLKQQGPPVSCKPFCQTPVAANLAQHATANPIPPHDSPAALSSNSSSFPGRSDRDSLNPMLHANSSSSLRADGEETQSPSCFTLPHSHKATNPPGVTDPVSLIPQRHPALADTTSSLEWSSGYHPTPSDCADTVGLTESSPEQIRERSSISSSETVGHSSISFAFGWADRDFEV